MSRRMLWLVCGWLFLATSPEVLVAQKRPPQRPRLDAGSDTNFAAAYYRHGLQIIEHRPSEAADAFYWAARLDPSWAQPLYARRVALLMADPHLLLRYMTSRDRRFYERREVLSLDSLELRARMLDPFVLRDLERPLITAFLTAWAEDRLQRAGYARHQIPRGELDYMIQNMLRMESSVWERAILAASDRRFPEALHLYSLALRANRNNTATLHTQRAQVFFVIGNTDSARVQMELALEQLRAREKEEFVRVYISKAVLEHSIGMIYERGRVSDKAREAYARALQEDLAYYPAHVRVGLLALTAGDTATALSEFALSVDLRDDDAAIRHTYGAVLASVGKHDEAAEQLHKAMELEPYYAAPYVLAGRVAEAANRPADALGHYQAFIARAHERDPQLSHARARVTALGSVAERP